MTIIDTTDNKAYIYEISANDCSVTRDKTLLYGDATIKAIET